MTVLTIHQLSAADVGIAISDGAQIAREIADITVSAEDLGQIAFIKDLSNNLIKKINRNYRTIVSFNSGLIALGVLWYNTTNNICIIT